VAIVEGEPARSPTDDEDVLTLIENAWRNVDSAFKLVQQSPPARLSEALERLDLVNAEMTYTLRLLRSRLIRPS
jgi:hypothetical protein